MDRSCYFHEPAPCQPPLALRTWPEPREEPEPEDEEPDPDADATGRPR